MQPASEPAPRLALTVGRSVLEPLPGRQPSLDLGLQWRQPVFADQHVDVTAWRRSAPPPDALTLIRQRQPTYGARVEMKIASRKRGLVTDLRFIGLQLDNGARITLRRRDGNPALYYRAQF